MVRRILLLLVVVALAGCGGAPGDGESAIESKVRRVANEAGEKKIERVDCAKDAKHSKQYRCKVELNSGDCQDWVINDVGTDAAYFGSASYHEYEGCDF